MKRLLLLLFLGAACLSLFAQKTDFVPELYIGFGGGGLSGNIDFVPAIPQTRIYSYHAGVSAKYLSEKHLGLLGEINLTRKGWKEEFDPEEEAGYSYNRSLTYIDLPIMTHIYIGNKTRFVINLGPQLSFLLGENSDMSPALADYIGSLQAEDPDAPVGVQYGPMSEMKRVDYGLLGGVGVELKTGLGNFNLEGRYYFGLGDVFTSRRSDNAYFSRSAHRVISAKLTYFIPLR